MYLYFTEVTILKSFFEMAEKIPIGEGASINRSPLFCVVNYQFWKVKMKFFVESIHRGIWDAIVNRPFIPKHEVEKLTIEKS